MVDSDTISAFLQGQELTFTTGLGLNENLTLLQMCIRDRKVFLMETFHWTERESSILGIRWKLLSGIGDVYKRQL